jgi:CubicO group peptidase (beta-lactamase class C family)
VALPLALLEQDGALDLDSAVETSVPELAGSPYGRCSLLGLSAHASGLPAWHPLFAASRDLEGYLGQIRGLAPAVAPGQTLYSDLGYIVLGAAIARAAGRSLERLFEERIARPLGLSRTAFATDRRRFSDAAATECDSRFEKALAGATGSGFAWREAREPGVVHDTNAWALGGVAGHAGLFGPLDDVVALGRALLGGGALNLGQRARARLLTPVRAGGRTAGLVPASQAAAARGILPGGAPGHTGFTGTSLWLDPARERLFVLLTNRIHPQVPAAPFHPLRRGFHRAALAELREHGSP